MKRSDMSFDEQPDDPHGECRDEIKRLRLELAAAEERAVQAERERETYRREWSKKVAESERLMCLAVEERDEARRQRDSHGGDAQ